MQRKDPLRNALPVCRRRLLPIFLQNINRLLNVCDDVNNVRVFGRENRNRPGSLIFFFNLSMLSDVLLPVLERTNTSLPII